MIEIISWNIQNGKGVDEVISLERTASVIKSMGKADVICLQEISRNLPEDSGAAGDNQVDILQTLFPDYSIVFGVAIDAAIEGSTRRWQYGNAILSRLPILSSNQFPLPQPAEQGVRHMARQATEVSVASALGPIRIMTTHLEYHSRKQRLAQIKRLQGIHAEIASNQHQPPAADEQGPYQQIIRPLDCIICGDFNIEPDSAEYAEMLGVFADSPTPLNDAWKSLCPEEVHPPSCGVYDHVHWPQGPHCRDFFFISSNLAQRCKKILVNQDTNASDHQPMMLCIDAS